MKLRLFYIFSIGLLYLAGGHGLLAQVTEPDTLQLEKPEAPLEEAQETAEDELAIPEVKGFAQSIEIGIDYPKLATFGLDNQTKWEGMIGIRFLGRLFLSGEFGYGDLQSIRAVKNGSYSSEGYYGRIGLDFVAPIDAKNIVFIGFRYAQSQFSHSGNYEIASLLWEDFTGSFRQDDMQANWGELVIGSDTEYRKNIHLGFIFRIRGLNTFQQTEDIDGDVYAIPGFGRTMDNISPALNLYIKYRLSFH